MTSGIGGQRRVTLPDALVIAWTLLWLLAGLAVAREVGSLADLSRTVSTSGRAIDDSGALLDSFSRLPLIGAPVGDVARGIRRAGRSVQASARESRRSVERLATILGLAIALIPSLPLLAVYLALRLARLREGTEIRRALAGADRTQVQRLLAERALVNLPYARLRAISERPWTELADGRYDRLAAAELERLGLD